MYERLCSGSTDGRPTDSRQSTGTLARALSACAVGIAMMAAAPARAQQPHETNPFEITPFYGVVGGGEFEDPLDNSTRDIKSDNSFGVIFNAAADWWRHYELLYVKQGTEVEGAESFDLDVEYLQLGGIVSHPEAQRVIPYFGLTLGLARLSPDGPGLDDETKIAFSAATGLRVPITEHFGLRFDLRAFATLLDTEGELFCVSSEGLTCRVRAKGDTLLQYSAALGVMIGF